MWMGSVRIVESKVDEFRRVKYNMSKSDDAVVVGRASPALSAGGDAHNPSQGQFCRKSKK